MHCSWNIDNCNYIKTAASLVASTVANYSHWSTAKYCSTWRWWFEVTYLWVLTLCLLFDWDSQSRFWARARWAWRCGAHGGSPRRYSWKKLHPQKHVSPFGFREGRCMRTYEVVLSIPGIRVSLVCAGGWVCDFSVDLQVENLQQCYSSGKHQQHLTEIQSFNQVVNVKQQPPVQYFH